MIGRCILNISLAGHGTHHHYRRGANDDYWIIQRSQHGRKKTLKSQSFFFKETKFDNNKQLQNFHNEDIFIEKQK
ncbi:hypothetical protein DERF_004650 [Dermatophagoides farinae]|uniref:Uncharacterized protein n=1 Tax=Dermatophagoides farinae TaxID=6954 RepID=A0A922LAC2_DERFA|nr:hypothetical protein DERF_004650 [Dermatophagoides farinae]